MKRPFDREDVRYHVDVWPTPCVKKLKPNPEEFRRNRATQRNRMESQVRIMTPLGVSHFGHHRPMVEATLFGRESAMFSVVHPPRPTFPMECPYPPSTSFHVAAEHHGLLFPMASGDGSNKKASISVEETNCNPYIDARVRRTRQFHHMKPFHVWTVIDQSRDPRLKGVARSASSNPVPPPCEVLQSSSQTLQAVMEKPPLRPQHLDVSALFDKLLASGLVKSTAENDSDLPQVTRNSSVDYDVWSVNWKATAPYDVPDLTDFNPDKLTKRYSGLVDRLYEGKQCSSCGLRFISNAGTEKKLREHLDWHFHENLKTKKLSNRQWYGDVTAWLTDKGTKIAREERTDLARGLVSCPSHDDAEGNLCPACHETFEQTWDDEREGWYLKNAIRINNETYHPTCYEDAKRLMSNCSSRSK